MNRRDILIGGAAAGAAALLRGEANAQTAPAPGGARPAARKARFKLKYAPHFGMFKESAKGKGGATSSEAARPFLDELKFAADQGFTAWEDNGMKGRPVDVQEAIAKEMQRLGMTMGVFVAHGSFKEPTFNSNKPEMREKILQDIKDSIEVAKRVNAKWCTVVPGHVDLRVEEGFQTAWCIDNLRRASELCEKAGLVMVLEPLNWFANHPGLFLRKIPQAYEICRAVNSPSCKILFDMYHQQVQEGNIIKNIDLAWDEVGYFQTGDNPGRKEPYTGEMHYRNIFKHIYDKGFQGVLGMEHGNSKPGKEGEMAVIQAYRFADAFSTAPATAAATKS
jgi:hydroxypyruvate isomerase